MPEPERSPLARLILFIACLSAIAVLAAGIHYLAFDLPVQKTVPPAPENCAEYRPCPFPQGDHWIDWNLYRCDEECCETAFDMHFVLTALSGA